jgi:hypothetical protein
MVYGKLLFISFSRQLETHHLLILGDLPIPLIPLIRKRFFCLVVYKFLKCRLPFVGHRSQLFRISSIDNLKVNVKVAEKTRPIRSFASSSLTSLTKIHVPDCQTKITVRNHSGEIADVFSNIFVVFALQVV